MKSRKAQSASVPVGTAGPSATSPLTPIGGADPLPATGAPAPPVKGNPVARDTRKGTRVLQGEADVAENAARELRASTRFHQILVANLGTADSIANALEFSVAWYREAKAGTVWNGYAREQSHLSWAYTLAMVDRLRAAFQAVAATDPTIEKEMPNFMQLLGVRAAVAHKAVVTKRKIKSGEIVVNKAAKPPRKSTKASTKAASTAPAPAPAPAAATQAPTAAPAAPEVTPVAPVANGVNGASH